jgi:hypothetical protein
MRRTRGGTEASGQRSSSTVSRCCRYYYCPYYYQGEIVLSQHREMLHAGPSFFVRGFCSAVFFLTENESKLFEAWSLIDMEKGETRRERERETHKGK